MQTDKQIVIDLLTRANIPFREDGGVIRIYNITMFFNTDDSLRFIA